MPRVPCGRSWIDALRESGRGVADAMDGRNFGVRLRGGQRDVPGVDEDARGRGPVNAGVRAGPNGGPAIVMMVP